ncbi:MAG: ATP-grasp domain-containing protein [Methanosarcinales archaeon]
MRDILIIGYNTRHICRSAKRAGYNVFSIEHFGDRDLFDIADGVAVFEEDEPSPEKIRELMDDFEYDTIVRGPGFESWDLETTDVPVLNNDTKVFERVSDKFWLAEYLRRLDVPHPETYLIEDVDPSELDYPLMAKPRRGAGGVENLLIRSCEELEDAKSTHRDFIVQEYIDGRTVSISLIASHGEARSIAASEQISFPWLTEMPYAYTGNITPFLGRHVSLMEELAELVASDLGLVGSNGVDFLIGRDGIVLLEVNPRFQGTLETVEEAYGINLFSMHVDSFSGILPERQRARAFAGKAILFAAQDIWIDEAKSDMLFECYKKGIVSDVSREGTLMAKNRPLTTIFSRGRTRKEVLDRLRTTTEYMNNILNSCNSSSLHESYTPFRLGKSKR